MEKTKKFTFQKPTKSSLWKYSKFYAILVVLAFIRAIFTYVFIIPNGFAPGGLSGLSSLIYNAVLPFNAQLAETVFNPGVTTFVLNIPLLVAALILLNKRFTLNTLLVVGVYSAFMGVFSAVNFPQYTPPDGDTGIMLLAAVAGGAGCGVSLGLMLRSNMSMGGTDIIGKIIYKYNPANDVQWWIFACDCVIVLASGGLGFINLDMSLGATAITTAVLSPILFSFISLVVTSEVADVIQSGLQSSIVFNIISSNPEVIAEEITNKLHRGVTLSKGVGYYTGEEHEILVCVVRKKQVNLVKNIVAAADPNAFLYITKAREVTGKGFTTKL
ncbi:MAG: YitT family protein [Clostridia bacterium]